MSRADRVKPVRWVGPSKKAFTAFPDEVQHEMGFALYRAQLGAMHVSAKPLRGFGGAGVVEIVEDHRGDTYRAIYTVRMAEAVYVLHAFQKKAKSGRATPRRELEVIAQRLRRAEEIAKGISR